MVLVVNESVSFRYSDFCLFFYCVQRVCVLCHLVTVVYVYFLLTVDGNWGEWYMW